MISLRSKTTAARLAAVLVLACHGTAAAADGAMPASGDPVGTATSAGAAATKVDAAATNADAAVGTAGRPLIQTVGEADQKIFVVDHGGKWSMHAENVLTSNIVRLWQQAGGPEVTMKEPVDRPFTLSVHAVAPEIIFERLFEGYGYTLHYGDDGALVSARIYSMAGSNTFKTPRLTESLSDWKKVEAGPEEAAAAAE